MRENILHLSFTYDTLLYRGYDELTDSVGQNAWDTVLTPRPVAHEELTYVAHDELTDVAMHCVHSFFGQRPKACERGQHGPWYTFGAQAIPCLSGYDLRPGINEPTLH